MLHEYVDSEKRVGVGFTQVFGGLLEPPLKTVAEHLVVAARLCGVEVVLTSVSGWLAGTPLSYERQATLVGATIDQVATLHDGLIRISKAPLSSDQVPAALRWRPNTRMGDIMGSPVLSVACTVGPVFHAAGAAEEDWPRFGWAHPIPRSFTLESFCEALSLACNGCVQVEYEWPHAPHLEPFWQHPSGSWQFRVRRPGMAVDITQDCLEEAWALWVTRHQGAGVSRALRYAISRWIRSKQRWAKENQLIELRVALEALYLDDGSFGEMSYRLATRGAWHLGDSVESRKARFQTLLEVYRKASSVLHGGKLKDKGLVAALVSDGQDACRESILKMLKEGKPDWQDLTLGGIGQAPNARDDEAARRPHDRQPS